MAAKKKAKDESSEPQGKEMTPGERIAYHQGALTTLIGERNELFKLVQITEQLMQAHIEELKKLGVKFPDAPPKE
ncbi:hypothetical protein CMI45_01635 [Candidatus Pacearchaeota archaeon]|nr:hypothetical protein [Candidatus Pacearchaeota archaeon]|tara:strand:- start:1620 stop:1844 length:225 start_codon:yes stop_codon:yes gene_type:complete